MGVGVNGRDILCRTPAPPMSIQSTSFTCSLHSASFQPTNVSVGVSCSGVGPFVTSTTLLSLVAVMRRMYERSTANITRLRYTFPSRDRIMMNDVSPTVTLTEHECEVIDILTVQLRAITEHLRCIRCPHSVGAADIITTQQMSDIGHQSHMNIFIG